MFASHIMMPARAISRSRPDAALSVRTQTARTWCQWRSASSGIILLVRRSSSTDLKSAVPLLREANL